MFEMKMKRLAGTVEAVGVVWVQVGMILSSNIGLSVKSFLIHQVYERVLNWWKRWKSEVTVISLQMKIWRSVLTHLRDKPFDKRCSMPSIYISKFLNIFCFYFLLWLYLWVLYLESIMINNNLVSYDDANYYHRGWHYTDWEKKLIGLIIMKLDTWS